MTTENESHQISDSMVAALSDQMEGMRQFVYLESRDKTTENEGGVTQRYSRILQYMVLATIDANPRITERKLLSLLRNMANVPEDICAWQLTILRNTRLPDSTDKLLYVYPVSRTPQTPGEVGHVVRHLVLNKNFNLSALASEYSSLTGVKLQDFVPEVFNSKSNGKSLGRFHSENGQEAG